MGVLSCPYRGPTIPRLLSKGETGDTCLVCSHPEIRGPATLSLGINANNVVGITGLKKAIHSNDSDKQKTALLEASKSNNGIRSCLGCTFWHDTQAQAKAKLEGLPELDPHTWSPPIPPPKPVSITTLQKLANCTNIGQDTSKLAECATGCKSSLKVFSCSAYGECTIDKPGVGVAGYCHNGCPKRTLNTPINGQDCLIVECDTYGYGDALILAWIAEGAKDSPRPLYLNASGRKRELLLLFGQTVVDQAGIRQDRMVKAEHAIRYTQSRLPFRSKQLGITTPYKRPVPTVSAAATQWAKQVMGGNTVLLCPQSVHAEREWQVDQWLELAKLLEDNGTPFLFMGSKPRREYDSYPGMYAISPVERDVALYQQAKAVVAVDSFPANLAGTLNTPTICILTITTPYVFDHCPSIQCVRGAIENAQTIYSKLEHLLGD